MNFVVLDPCTDIKIVTMDHGSQNSWNFGTCNSASGTQYSSFGTVIESCCQPRGQYTLNCMDNSGDGWHGGYIEIAGAKYCDSFLSGSSASFAVTMPGRLRFINT